MSPREKALWPNRRSFFLSNISSEIKMQRAAKFTAVKVLYFAERVALFVKNKLKNKQHERVVY